jgi:hypothetical protein
MARYDPRYDYSGGYALGDMLTQLGGLLGQGFARYNTYGQQEEATQEKQRDYLLKLQDMLTKSEDRDLDRTTKALYYQNLAADTATKRAEGERKAALDTARRSAAATLGMVPEYTEVQGYEPVESTEKLGPHLMAPPEKIPIELPVGEPVRRKRSFAEALGFLSPEQRIAMTPEDRALYEKIYPGEVPLDPLKVIEAVTKLGSAEGLDPATRTSLWAALAKGAPGLQLPGAPKFREVPKAPTEAGIAYNAARQELITEGVENPNEGAISQRVEKNKAAGRPVTETGLLLDLARARARDQGNLTPSQDDLVKIAEEIRRERSPENWHGQAEDELKQSGKPYTWADVQKRANELKEASATRVVTAGERARQDVPMRMREAESKLWRDTVNTQGKLDDLKELVGSPNVNLAKMAGGVRPWVNEIIQTGKIGPIPIDPTSFGGSLTREENMFLAALYDAADLTLRQRSGAQINETEFKWMLQFLAGPGVRPEVLIDRLDLQRHNNARQLDILEHQAREEKFIVPSRPPRQPLLGESPAGPKEMTPAEKRRRLEELERKARGG